MRQVADHSNSAGKDSDGLLCVGKHLAASTMEIVFEASV